MRIRVAFETVATVVEDLPQLVLQVIVWEITGTFSLSSVVSMALSIVALVWTWARFFVMAKTQESDLSSIAHFTLRDYSNTNNPPR